MKHLSILRHGKAEHGDLYPTDLERPLTNRGQKDAFLIGQMLTDVDPTIDWIVSSPAQRTRETAEAVIDALRYKRGIAWQDAIYDADGDALLNVLAQVPVEMEHVLIIGHNPGMELLISGLAAGSPTRLGISMPTGGLAHLTLEIYGWNQIRWGCGTLHSLMRPKFIRPPK
jgi:phosphohistidine phosphatase